MNNENNKNIIIVLLVVIIVILASLVVLFATNTITFNFSENKTNKINDNTTEEIKNSNQENKTEQSNVGKYNGQSFVGSYQLLNYDFAVSEYDSSKNSHLDLEIKLLEDGTAKVAYQLNDNGNIITNQYNATYTLENILTAEIDGDNYKVLELKYISSEALNDDIISQISTNITYNPATNPTDGTQSFPKSLVIRCAVGNMIPHIVDSSELKYIK